MASLLLVEDHTLFRAGIRALVERSASGHRIVGEAADGLTATRLARQLLPDITLMDVTMPTLNGIEAAGLLSRECPHTRVVILSMHADPAYIYAALDAGAFAYVLKDAAFGELETAIRTVLAGQKYLSQGVRHLLHHGHPQSGRASPLLAALSMRERQVLQLVGEAHSSAEIAAELGLSVRTIETYRQNLMDKLDLHSAAALTAFAIQSGVASPRSHGIADAPPPTP